MKLLLDENLPKRLKHEFTEYAIFTVHDMGWNGKTNGELLQLMLKEQIDILITFDKNLRYQQSLSKYPILVIVLNAKDNSFLTLSKLVPKIKKTLLQYPKRGAIEIKEM